MEMNLRKICWVWDTDGRTDSITLTVPLLCPVYAQISLSFSCVTSPLPSIFKKRKKQLLGTLLEDNTHKFSPTFSEGEANPCANAELHLCHQSDQTHRKLAYKVYCQRTAGRSAWKAPRWKEEWSL